MYPFRSDAVTAFHVNTTSEPETAFVRPLGAAIGADIDGALSLSK